MAKSVKTSGKTNIKLIVSGDKNPTVKLKPGMKLQVASVQLVDPNFKKVPLSKATLCSSSSTCLAIIDIAD